MGALGGGGEGAPRGAGLSATPSRGAGLSESPYILIGNPENRRVTLFQAALEAQGLPPARVVSWRELIEDLARLAALPDRPALLRIDSAGEDFEVERGLLRLGHEDAVRVGCSTLEPAEVARLVYDRGRILAPRQQHLGFLRLLAAIGEVLAERPGWRPLSPLAAVADLFDKRITSRRYHAAGIPVPPFLDGVGTPEALRAAMRERGWRAVFVKVSCGSSASCLAVYHLGPDGGHLMTTIEETPTARYNNLRVRRVSERARVDGLLEFLLREGSQLELALPKAHLDGAYFDCRVLCVAGEPAFTVIRQNRHPITNLHLGGWRGDPRSLAAVLPAEVEAAARESCRRVAALHGCHQLGVDLLYETGLRRHAIVEANAFGDLLPNLTRDGLSVYEWEIRAASGIAA